MSSAIGGAPLDKNNSFANHMTHAGAGAASAIANAATRTLINGSNFGDNLMAGLPDIIGATIGNMVAYGVGGTGAGAAKGISVNEEALARAGKRAFGGGVGAGGSGGIVEPGTTAATASEPTAGVGGGRTNATGAVGAAASSRSAGAGASATKMPRSSSTPK